MPEVSKEEVEQRAREEAECCQVEEQWRLEVERCKAKEQAKKCVSHSWFVMTELTVFRQRGSLCNSGERARGRCRGRAGVARVGKREGGEQRWVRRRGGSGAVEVK